MKFTECLVGLSFFEHALSYLKFIAFAENISSLGLFIYKIYLLNTQVTRYFSCFDHHGALLYDNLTLNWPNSEDYNVTIREEVKQGRLFDFTSLNHCLKLILIFH